MERFCFKTQNKRSKNWKFQKKSLYLQRQNVVRGRERFAFGAIFKLDLSDQSMRT
jgi:hypothetical protein